MCCMCHVTDMRLTPLFQVTHKSLFANSYLLEVVMVELCDVVSKNKKMCSKQYIFFFWSKGKHLRGKLLYP